MSLASLSFLTPLLSFLNHRALADSFRWSARVSNHATAVAARRCLTRMRCARRVTHRACVTRAPRNAFSTAHLHLIRD